jgi:hypothetical protein
VIIGWIAVFLLPIVALVIGIILWNRGDRRGIPITLLPLAVALVWLIIGLSIAGGGSPTVGSPGGKEIDCSFDSKPTATQRERCLSQGGFTVQTD